jgi:hypothetical protein|tara:strand:+ start:5168 stop:5839 length:672 start_codon:yes stop_codon:yes gene_type:complete
MSIGLNILEVLSASCSAFALNNGFIKKDQIRYDKKYEGKLSNSDLLYSHFYSEDKLTIEDKDTDLAVEIIDYLKGLSFKAIERELTDFERNVLKLVTSETIKKEQIGIAASLPKVYLNKLEQDRWTDRENTLSKTSTKLGKLHERQTFEAYIEFIRYIPRTMSYIVTCSIDDKHILKFFYDKNLTTNTTINIQGFIKSQSKGRFHNGYETIVNRVKIGNDIKT